VNPFENRTTVALLRKFIPMKEWSNRQLEPLARTIKIQRANIGETLIKRGSRDELSYYLVSGKVQLTAGDGKVAQVDAESAKAANPLSQLLPRKYEVTCLTPVEYLCVDNILIYQSKAERDFTDQPTGYEVSEEGANLEELVATTAGDSISKKLITQLEEDLRQDRLNIPSLPEIATRIGRAMEEESSNANTIARIIQTDPAITAKIVKAANSAFYGSQNPVETCPQAVIRLGMTVTHSLVINYTMQDLFTSKSKAINVRMHHLWMHSVRVAAICHVLAKHYSTLNPDEAMTIGLLHDIGVAAILNQASNYPELAADPIAIDETIKELRGPFCRCILESWRFSDVYIAAAEEAENWMREGDGPADYCDILILAQLHSYVGSDMALETPSLETIPAMSRLKLGPDQSIAVLQELNEEIDRVKTLLQF
jgi:HD-like signal output (HDOD) protein